jgi:uncharacterized protein (DUF427 family)
VEPVAARIRVVLGGITVADTTGALRVLETSHPPNYYLPPADILDGALVPARGTSWCEWKGEARYFDVTAGGTVAEGAAWAYDRPTRGFTDLTGMVAFYPGRMEACFVGDERVEPQPGGFYGGWITANLIGPFKGAPGTQRW